MQYGRNGGNDDAEAQRTQRAAEEATTIELGKPNPGLLVFSAVLRALCASATPFPSSQETA
jgi:hypothetical protein